MLKDLLNIEKEAIERIENHYSDDKFLISVFQWFWKEALNISNNNIECRTTDRYIAIYLKNSKKIICYIEPIAQQIKVAFWAQYYSYIAKNCPDLHISSFQRWAGANREVKCMILTNYQEQALIAFEILFQFKKYGKIIEIKNTLELDFSNPEEITNLDSEIFEGAKKQIVVNFYERDVKGRRICLNHFGYTCSVCEFNFEKQYGKIGENFIHVHHIKPIASIKQTYQLNPIEDLRPVCPNCHAMLHAKNPPYSIHELKIIRNNIKIKVFE